MIRSYIKTSIGNVLRNKLFSFINIVGLAISMSVGLLLIAFVLDLRSYDRFHENGHRIYRITSVVSDSPNRRNSSVGDRFATTSLKAGKLIRQKVTGIDDVAILHTDFSKDATVGTTILPIKGFWADPSFFRIFTFPMLAGNSETALNEPYSVVLTQTAARKLFGRDDVLGRLVRFDTLDYRITGVMKDVPFFSHINFEALISLSTAEQLNKTSEVDKWTRISSNFVYLLLAPTATRPSVQSQLDALAKEENYDDATAKIRLTLHPLHEIVVGASFSRSEGGPGTLGPHMPPTALWILCGLALVVILSACFNYTNLSMARAMRRSKEVGLRKAIGAGKHQVWQQFLVEAVMISLAALLLSFFLFLALRPQLVNLAPEIQRMVKLELSPSLLFAFVGFSITVGIAAGLAPALFYANVSAINVLRNVALVNVFRHLTLRRALVVVQYTLTLIFITATAIGFVQYKNILAFDLGYRTDNILNITMQGNKPDVFMKVLREMPDVAALSRSLLITSVGNAWGGYVTYRNGSDSALVMTNHVDEHYLPLHEYKLVAGSNFRAHPTTAAAVGEVIVNQQLLKRFNISVSEPEKAIGQSITFRNVSGTRKLTIVGVMKNAHYGKVDNLVGPVAFLHWTPEDRAVINVRLQSRDLLASRARIEAAWKKFDRIHPLQAEFYDDSIEEAYSEIAVLIKIIGFLSFLAISIASMGLFGMVAFTTETRLKEISIRKVMGASTGNLVFLLSRGFLVQLAISALIALPVTYLFFETIVLTRFPYHIPVHMAELVAGLLVVLLIAGLLIGSQTVKAAKSNPVDVLKSN